MGVDHVSTKYIVDDGTEEAYQISATDAELSSTGKEAPESSLGMNSVTGDPYIKADATDTDWEPLLIDSVAVDQYNYPAILGTDVGSQLLAASALRVPYFNNAPAALAAGSDSIKALAGTHDFTGVSSIDRDVTIIGVGQSATVLNLPAPLPVTGHLTIENCTIETSDTSVIFSVNAGGGLTLRNCNVITQYGVVVATAAAVIKIDDCNIAMTESGSAIDFGLFDHLSGTQVTNTRFLQVTGACIGGRLYNAALTGNIVMSDAVESAAFVDVDQIVNAVIAGNYAEVGARFLLSDDATASVISHNVIYRPTAQATGVIEITNSVGVQISGNVVENSAADTHLYAIDIDDAEDTAIASNLLNTGIRISTTSVNSQITGNSTNGGTITGVGTTIVADNT
jgi:hypothetical protein